MTRSIDLATQSASHRLIASVSPGSLLEIQNLRLHFGPADLKTQGFVKLEEQQFRGKDFSLCSGPHDAAASLF